MHYPNILVSLNFFAAAIIFRSCFQHFESRYQVLIFVVIAALVELNAQTLFQRTPSSGNFLLFVGSSFLAILLAKWAIEDIPWWMHRWFL
jgi:Na+-translocating ferredoxin:NAD+ oxidoreductase RnfD subunit